MCENIEEMQNQIRPLKKSRSFVNVSQDDFSEFTTHESKYSLSARDFYKAFISAVGENLIAGIKEIPSFPRLAGFSYWEIYRKHEPAYTELVNKYIIHNIIANTLVAPEAPKEEYKYLIPQHEYFRIDSTGYQHRYYEIPEDEATAVDLNRHFWELKIAVEHENDKKDWMDEVIKLAHIKCPLKVVIGYSPCDERDEQETEKLEFISKWLKKLSAFENSSNEELLIILGNSAPKDKSNGDYNCFDYRGYLYNSQYKEFRQI